MFCGRCGVELAGGARFCSACGAPVAAASATQTATQANPDWASQTAYGQPSQPFGQPWQYGQSIVSDPVSDQLTRLQRPRTNRMVAGVCAGLALHYRWDLTWVRVVTVLITVFSSGAGLIAYIVFWLVMPEEMWALPSTTAPVGAYGGAPPPPATPSGDYSGAGSPPSAL